MTYASLRFAGVQRLRSLEVDEDPAHGTALLSKTRKPHGLPWPWACPRMGVSGSTECVTPLIEFHVAHEKKNGAGPRSRFPFLIVGGNSKKLNQLRTLILDVS